jgi:3-deoxy-manno-octulosonate cytidylyltransferase (CMP-KDO synthetase)
MEAVIVIPARYASTRYPGKPLVPLRGASGNPRTLIERSVMAAREASRGAIPIFVATDDARIEAEARRIGVEVIMTSESCRNGTERVAEAIARAGLAPEIVVNLQGDLPTLDPDAIRAVLTPLADPGTDIATLVTAIHDASEASAPNFVKAAVVFGEGAATARALYFSRLPVPYGHGPLWHHIGIYAWRREALARFVTLPPSGLELREKLEQLRAMEAGMTIACARIATAPFGVDTPEDLARARSLLEEPTT